MIQVNDPKVQALIGLLTKQREEAFDSFTLAQLTIAERDSKIAELEQKLEANNQPK